MAQDTRANTLALSVVQMTSAPQQRENIEFAGRAFAMAAENGSLLICFPETANVFQKDPKLSASEITEEHDDPFTRFCQESAREHGLWVHVGSVAVRDADSGKYANRTLLIDPRGEVVVRYNKIHLFDVELASGETHRESSRYQPGGAAVLADTPWGKAGMSICYDLRFPHLFRDLARAGAAILFVPAAFTVPTGKAHWEVLLRARAIENGAYVIAAAQTGSHVDGRQTYGHSLVVDPWGRVLLDMGETPGVAHTEIELGRVGQVRQQIPSLANERAYAMA